jgi:tRNA A-37 threonylcarbamoyl transferase component Bud32
MAQPSRVRKLGSYEVLQELGQGGMGVVYLARQPALERLAVLKRIRRELLTDRRMLERFHREARAAAAVHHQNVVAVYDCFPVRDDHYIAQEYVDGEDLRTILDGIGRIDADVAALIGLEVIRGLEMIHASGTIHRDLKPANILLAYDGAVKIADFGIALDWRADGLTQPGTVIGSIPYVSPEQMQGKRVDYRSDLFAFGVLLYEMIVGRPPFVGSEDDSSEVVLQRMKKSQFVAPRKCAPVPRYLSRLIETCLRATPSRRPASAEHVRRTLERHLGGVCSADSKVEIAAFLRQQGVLHEANGQTAVRAQPGATRRRRRRRAWMLPAAAAALLLLLGTTYFAGRASNAWRGVEEVQSAATEPGREVSPATDPIPAFGESPLPTHSAGPIEAVPPPEPARVRFAAHPWARIRVDDGEGFHTPRAEFLTLEPGPHHVVFEHPALGKAEYDFELTPGETQLIRHDFEEVAQP